MKTRNNKHKVEQKLIGYVAVDSGQVIISDPAWLEHFVSNEAPTRYGKNGKDFNYSYEGCCRAALSKKQAGQLKLRSLNGKKLAVPAVGVAARTRHGDWLYPVYGFYRNGDIAAVLIDFDIFEEFEEHISRTKCGIEEA